MRAPRFARSFALPNPLVAHGASELQQNPTDQHDKNVNKPGAFKHARPVTLFSSETHESSCIMFSSLDWIRDNSGSSRRVKLASVGGGSTGGISAFKLAPRRTSSWLLCRLPLLILWTLVVIFFLYKSLSSTNELQATIPPASESTDLPTRSYTKPAAPQLLIQKQVFSTSAQKDFSQDTSKDHESFRSTTNKADSSEWYAKQSRVFILIIEKERFPLPSPQRPTRPQNNPSTSDSVFKSSTTRNTRNKFTDISQPFTIPAHIKVLIEILDSHRIAYSIDTTRSGLPTALLTDQDSSSENKKYSVLVIDDFIKYTKLSRWIRDQLDRHCRTNEIGVVTYLTNIDIVENANHQQLRRSVLDYFDTVKTSVLKKSTSSAYAINAPSSPTTKESVADQFPLRITPIEQHSCSNLSSSCLRDYQVNEESPILRILKRRPDFILPGPVIPNLNRSPWFSMSSDHITYEPLTWARLHESKKSSRSGFEPAKVKLPSAGSSTRESNSLEYVSGETNDEREPMPRDASNELKNQFQRLNSTNMAHWENHEQTHMLARHETSSLQPANNLVSRGHDLIDNDINGAASYEADPLELQILSTYDRGLFDGIKRVIFGGANHFWLNRVLFLDAIEHLSSGRILNPLERYLQIDIDDIFVGETGKRMKRDDVEALIETQRKFSTSIKGGFKFNLGFSGKFFKHGQEDEKEGDELLIENAKEFTWFCHTWSHSKAHLFNNTEDIIEELQKNLNFARDHQLPIIGHKSSEDLDLDVLPPTYAVAPHHSGVYPVHSQLYRAWREVLNVQVTSTEEYPHLKPANARRAFVHQTIKVLPRQTCGLFTHTIYRDKYPGGLSKLDALIKGGELFETVLHNPVNIYMTHMTNYANDRLAPYTFAALLDFVQQNTNLQLRYAPSSPWLAKLSSPNKTSTDSNHQRQLGPAKLAEYYLSLFTNERQPLWTNPCNDRRHLDIWAQEKHKYCSNVPKLLIVGPQKTGTTALYTYLKMNPIFKPSSPSASDYEEVQFFNDKHYFNGVDWYFSRFTDGQSETIFYDKSATYFDDPQAARRASALLPDARIVILLVDPADRAYSWYQHIKAHGDPTANSVSFEQVITFKEFGYQDEKSKALQALHNRCLHPGYYSQHLSKWLEFYHPRQIILIDGLWFRHNPASVMKRLQLLLGLREPLDYESRLVFSEWKGFFCQLVEPASEGNGTEQVKCLGQSKGRKYPPMSKDARNLLNRHYWRHNRQLARLLIDIGLPLPTWMDDAMSLDGLRASVIY